MSNPLDYTVGCICALPEESAALQAFLDARHDGPEYISTHDNNDYTLGRIGKHNVVICVLPSNQYGIVAAATVARDLAHSFPNVRIGLMVGIAGGAPNSRSEVHLGDVVVGVACNGSPAVFQYDYGKAIQGHGFQTTGFINQPPQILLTAVNGLRAFYEVEGECLEEAVKSALEKRPRMKQKYQRPDASTDRLYRSSFIHPDPDLDCTLACGDCKSRLSQREKWDNDGPTVHYGLIASSNSLMKDAHIRDDLVKKNGMLCFEMEAAGLLNHFPCLVIRGICDYSDSHKNKKWQGYASMIAAAYARDLLGRIAPSRVEAERTIGDLYSDISTSIHEHLNLTKKQHQYHRDQAMSKKEQACHQIFRLSAGDRDVTYEWYKDRIANRVEGTCSWFTQHTYFQDWLAQESGPLLVSADPGCGKSVLAKYLVDVVLPRESCICYFFFKDQDQSTMRQALCALLHQLFHRQPALIKHALPQFEADGESLRNSTASLWKVFEASIKDPQAGSIIIVLDALDECTEGDLKTLVSNIEGGVSCGQNASSRLKWLLTCRPYDQIMSRFSKLRLTCPQLHIPGDDKSEDICKEVNQVIMYRANEFAKLKSLTVSLKDHLYEHLQMITHRTYLWVHLVFEYLDREGFKKTTSGLDSAINTLPKSVSDAYEQILRKSKDRSVVQRVLSIILAASRPLSVSELNTAMNVSYDSKSIESLDLEEEDDFRARLRDWCGLFISIHNNKVYLLHQTAREFLLADSHLGTTALPECCWQHSIAVTTAHSTLAQICVLYLALLNSTSCIEGTYYENGIESIYVTYGNFFHYSALNWDDHFRLADMKIGSPILPFTLQICDSSSKSYKIWFVYSLVWKKRPVQNLGLPIAERLRQPTSLLVASYLGHSVTADLMLKRGDDIDSRDGGGQTPLFWAAIRGSTSLTSLLLENGADPNARDCTGTTPLHVASIGGNLVVVKLLLQYGALSNAKNEWSETPLCHAVRRGEEDITKALLENGADADAGKSSGRTPLSIAIAADSSKITQLLLARGANTEIKDVRGNTPLLIAVWLNHIPQRSRSIMQIATSIKVTDTKDGTAVLEATDKIDNHWIETTDTLASVRPQHTSTDPCSMTATILLANGANIEAKDSDGRTPLLVAAREGCCQMMLLLLENGANIEATGPFNRTSIFVASATGNQVLVELLADRGARLDVVDDFGNTPLTIALANSHDQVVAVLQAREKSWWKKEEQ